MTSMQRPFRLALRGTLALVTAAALAPTALPAQEELPPAAQLIDRFIEAIGGREAVLAPTGSHSVGTFSVPAAGLDARMEIYAARDPDRLATVVDVPGFGIVRRGYTGEYGWSVDPSLGPRLLDGPELVSMTEGASDEASLRDPALFSERTTVERTEMNGEACYKVRLVWNSGRETFDCYSVESGLLIASQADEEMPMGSVPVTTLISDYTAFGDIRSPTRIVQQMMGQEQVITIDTVEYGEIDDARFAPPPSVQTLIEEKEAGGSGGGR